MPAFSLSKPLDQVRPRYDVIVVGSGYGGGVAASRLARAGRSVCVLERGREVRTGEFGSGLAAAWRDIQLTGRLIRFDSPLSLFDVRMGPDLHVVTANGLGGGSLVNAAIALRADMEVFARRGWPRTLGSDGHLAEGYARAERMLGVSVCPEAAGLPKFAMLARAAAVVGATAEPAPAAISWSAGSNAANVLQYACRRCGDCWSGCNVGAKNTLPLTYLADAAAAGAELFTLASVRRIAKAEGGGWRVHVVDTVAGGDGRVERWLTADTVVLAAGTLGSAEILLRSREAGLPLSDQLGQGMSGNGDEMFIGVDMPEVVNGISVGFPPRAVTAPVGPGTAGMIRYRDAEWDGRQILIQDGSMLPLMARMTPLKSLMNLEPRRALRMLFDGPYAGARARTGIFYTVSDDDAGGRMRLARDRVVVDWPFAADQACFRRSEAVTRRMVEGLGGRLLPNPLSERLLGGRKVTVHPLGGCAMGEDAATGVVDAECRVFDPSRGSDAVHDGLLVCDGSVMRGALGVNPLLTIAAFAERAMMLLAARQGWRFETAPNPAAAPRDAMM